MVGTVVGCDTLC